MSQRELEPTCEITLTRDDGVRELRTYDARGELHLRRSAEGLTRYRYDASGRLVELRFEPQVRSASLESQPMVSMNRARRAQFHYQRGRSIGARISEARGSGRGDGAAVVIERRYDDRGRLVERRAHREQRGMRTALLQELYQNEQLVVRVELESGLPVRRARFGYDSAGRLVTESRVCVIADALCPQSLERRHRWDAGRWLGADDAAGGAWRPHYRDGRLVRVQEPNAAVSFDYDGVGRLVRETSTAAGTHQSIALSYGGTCSTAATQAVAPTPTRWLENAPAALY